MCSASPIAVKHQNETQPLQPEDHEKCGRAGKILDMDSGGTAEIEREQEQRDEFGDGDEQSAGNVVDAMGERHQQRRSRR